MRNKSKPNKRAITYNKWPRQYAAEISELKTREQRQAALALVPEELRPIVKTHVKNNFLRIRFIDNE